MNLILLGPPGSGKGTQSLFLREELEVPSISTGDILRDACQKETELGKKAKEYMSSGKLVPDDLVVQIIEKRISEDDCKKGYILDGFPRTLNQANALASMLEEKKQKIDHAVNLEVTEEDLVERLSGRRVCSDCGAGYHLKFAPTSTKGVCDRCGGKLFQRNDDKEETIRNRLKIYKDQTEPLIEFYRGKNVLSNIAGNGDVKVVFESILKAIGRR